jgi:multiple sugar transport system permease protein
VSVTEVAHPATADGGQRDRASVPVRTVLVQIGRYTFMSAVLGFFALPLLWLATAPFDSQPTITTSLPDFTLDNFRVLLDNPYAVSSLLNSVYLAGGTAVLVVTFAALAAYALSRVRMPGRDALLYGLLLLSSIVTGTATMVPLFELAFRLHLIDSRLGVILILSGGLLPAAIFILKDFMDSTPTSYEESARVFGASPLQIVRHIVVPVVRPGLATVAVWAVANVWGNFLVPFLLLRGPDKAPAAVIMYTLYTEGGQANLALLSTFSLLYSLPVVLMFVFVSSRYGFRFHGGIKR